MTDSSADSIVLNVIDSIKRHGGRHARKGRDRLENAPLARTRRVKRFLLGIDANMAGSLT